METVLTREKLVLFVVFVFPGLVSMHIYRLIMPARGIKSSAAFLEASFYSIINFVIFLPVLAPRWYSGFAVRPLRRRNRRHTGGLAEKRRLYVY